MIKDFARTIVGVVFATTLAASLAGQPTTHGHWPQWRGPNRDNVCTETGLLGDWPEAGPPLVWRVAGLGEGIAPVSVAGGRIFTVGQLGEVEYLIALEEGTGRHLWTAPLGRAVRQSPLMRWLSQRAPTVDDDRVYVLTAEGELVCLAVADGSERWRRNYVKDFDGKRGLWGFCDYPLVDGEKLICTPGGKKATIVALEKRTGGVLWHSALPGDDWPAYAATVLCQAGGVRQYLVFLYQGLVGVAADDGRLLWHYGKLVSEQNALTPLVRGNEVLCASGRNPVGIALLELTAHGGDRFTVNERYFQPPRPNHFQDSLVAVGEHVYGTSWTGPFCIAWDTGELVWSEPIPRSAQSRGKPMAAILYGDGRLYLRQSDGTVKLVEANPKEYRERGSFKIPEHQPSIGATFPVIAAGRLYLRDNDNLFCYDVRAEAPETPRGEAVTIALPKPDPSQAPAAATGSDNRPDAVFVPTPHDVVDAMLKAAAVNKDDAVIDLGSGDGRIVITAAGDFGCKAVGYEIDDALVKLSRQRVRESKLANLVHIEQQDLFKADLSGADVVAVYLPPELLKRLMPQFAKLEPGARIVSHQFRIPGIEPDQATSMVSDEDGEQHAIYLWTAPLKKVKPSGSSSWL